MQRTNVIGDEFSIVYYENEITKNELTNILREVSNELESYNVDEHIETWDTETMDKMRNLENLYSVKIFE